MAREGKRKRIGVGIYRDTRGLAATVKVGSQQREKRFPKGTDPAVIRAWQEKERTKLRAKRPHVDRGPLAQDAARYLKLVAHLASKKARKVEVMAWVAELAGKHRNEVKPAHVYAARSKWLGAGLSPKTINNRVQTLRHLYRTLDGKQAETPCDEIAPLAVPKTPPQVISPETIIGVDTTLQHFEQVKRLLSAKTRARFRVYATSGRRPCEIMRTQPEDIDLERRVWYVRDAKGGYTPGLYLNNDLLAAWQFFIEAEAWGKFDTNSFARSLRSAGWPAGVRPYNLRHSLWITASERGADLSDIQAGAGHKSMATTRRHYVPVLNSRMQRLGELVDGRMTWETVPADCASRTADSDGQSRSFLRKSVRR